jgi:hypothetical protein
VLSLQLSFYLYKKSETSKYLAAKSYKVNFDTKITKKKSMLGIEMNSMGHRTYPQCKSTFHMCLTRASRIAQDFSLESLQI